MRVDPSPTRLHIFLFPVKKHPNSCNSHSSFTSQTRRYTACPHKLSLQTTNHPTYSIVSSRIMARTPRKANTTPLKANTTPRRKCARLHGIDPVVLDLRSATKPALRSLNRFQSPPSSQIKTKNSIRKKFEEEQQRVRKELQAKNVAKKAAARVATILQTPSSSHRDKKVKFASDLPEIIRTPPTKKAIREKLYLELVAKGKSPPVASPEYQPPQYLSPQYDDNDDDSTSQPTQRLPCLCNADEYTLWTSPA